MFPNNFQPTNELRILNTSFEAPNVKQVKYGKCISSSTFPLLNLACYYFQLLFVLLYIINSIKART